MANLSNNPENKFVNANETQRIIDPNGQDITPTTFDDLLGFVLGELAMGGILIQRERVRYYVVNQKGNVFDVRPDCARRVIEQENIVPIINDADGAVTMYKDVQFVTFLDIG